MLPLLLVLSTFLLRLHGALKFNGGGHLNHSIFWQNLCPGGLTQFPVNKSLDFQTKLFVVKYQHALSGSGEPEGDLEAAIVRDFGSVAAMKEKLSASTVAVQVTLESDVVRSKVFFSHMLLSILALDVDVVRSKVLLFSHIPSNTRAPDGAGWGTIRPLGSCKSPHVPTR